MVEHHDKQLLSLALLQTQARGVVGGGIHICFASQSHIAWGQNKTFDCGWLTSY